MCECKQKMIGKTTKKDLKLEKVYRLIRDHTTHSSTTRVGVLTEGETWLYDQIVELMYPSKVVTK